MNNILVTTTSTLEGWEIKKYIKPVSAHLVLGTNIFSDLFADFSDVFGGRSGTHQKKIAELYRDAIAEIKHTAFSIGANCIVGLSVDLDEISGKGKSMFMLTATGTAVLAKRIGESAIQKFAHNDKIVSSEKIRSMTTKLNLIGQAEAGELELNEANMAFITEYKISELFNYIFDQYSSMMYDSEKRKSVQNSIINYVANLEEESKETLIYERLVSEKDEQTIELLIRIIKQQQLLNLTLVKNYLEKEDFFQNKRAIIPLSSHKPFYNTEDLHLLEEISQLMKERFKEKGERTTKKQMFSSKEKEVWNCECGNKNQTEEYCFNCQKDIYGFKKNELSNQAVERILDSRIHLLKQCLAQ